MRLRRLCLVAIVGMAALTSSARAEDPPNVAAKQVAGLFMQSCIQFAGDKEGLRSWAKKTGLKELPAGGQDKFLYGLPGVVFDASNKDGKFVLVSEDGGSCSVIAEMANGPVVITDLEQALSDAKIAFKVTAEKSDAQETALKHREYQASQGERELAAAGQHGEGSHRRPGDADRQPLLRPLAKPTSRFVCQSCGAVSPKWAGRCEACDEWNSIVEEAITARPGPAAKGAAGTARRVRRPGRQRRTAAALPDRHRRAGPRAGRRAGAGLGGPGRRRPRHRQVHPAAAGGRQPGPRRAARALHLRRGIDRADPPARPPPRRPGRAAGTRRRDQPARHRRQPGSRPATPRWW